MKIIIQTSRGEIEFNNNSKGITGFIKLLNQKLNEYNIYVRINFKDKKDKEFNY